MMSINQAVILAGGRGERLLPLTLERPKPMLLFHGKPFLEFMIKMLAGQGITHILLLLGYLSDQIVEYFGDGSRWGVHIRYSVTDVSDDTGTRLTKAKHFLDVHFLLLYCDNYWPLDLRALLKFYERLGRLATVTVYSNKDGFTKNNVKVGADGIVEMYDKARQADRLNGVEIGFYVLERSVLDLLPEGNNNFEREALPKLIVRRQLTGFVTDQPYYSVSTLERLPRTETFLSSLRA